MSQWVSIATTNRVTHSIGVASFRAYTNRREEAPSQVLAPDATSCKFHACAAPARFIIMSKKRANTTAAAAAAVPPMPLVPIPALTADGGTTLDDDAMELL